MFPCGAGCAGETVGAEDDGAGVLCPGSRQAVLGRAVAQPAGPLVFDRRVFAEADLAASVSLPQEVKPWVIL